MATRLTIREQGALSWRKQVEIAVDGIQYRLLRSTLTLGVVVLAIAFLTNILVESRVAAACKAGVQARAAEQRELTLLASFLDAPLDGRELASRIADLPPGTWPLSALAGWLDLPGNALAPFRTACRSWRDSETWLAERAPGHRRLLAGKRDMEDTFSLLAEEEGRRAFAAAARRIPLAIPPGFLAFAGQRPAFLAELDTRSARLAAAQSRFRARLNGRSLADWLAATEPAAAAAILAEQGLRIESGRFQSLVRRAHERDEERRLLSRLRAPNLPPAWRTRFGRVFEQDQAIVRLARDPALAEWLLEQPAPVGLVYPPLTAANAGQAAARILESRRVTDTEDRLRANYGDRPGMNANMFWLLVVSFLVCMAGITNAMLLSVIERFREIATMKCLGALNGFIARLFLLEAAFLGLVGGLLGVLLGGIIGLSRMAAAYGEWVRLFFPGSGLAADAGIATACGLVLATLSALYPAWSAARMPPIEAMRVE